MSDAPHDPDLEEKIKKLEKDLGGGQPAPAPAPGN